MLIGTQTDYCHEAFGMKEAIKIITEAGFDSIDISMFNFPLDSEPWTLPDEQFDAYFADIAKDVHAHGATVGQTHPPFPTYTDNPEHDEKLLGILARSIRATSILGGKYAIIHPANSNRSKYEFNSDEFFNINLERYLYLYEYLEKYDVYCAIENMFSRDSHTKLLCPTGFTTAESMVRLIDELNSRTNSNRYVACFDTGHSNLIHYDGYETVNPVDMIHILGHRLKALHVHDNDGIDDRHVLPHLGTIDWEALCGALRDIGYNGVFTLEADNFPRIFKQDSALESEKLMYSVARSLVDKYID